MSEVESSPKSEVKQEIELGTLAAKINAEHRACEEAARSAVDRGIRCGEMLAGVKASLGHGEWLPWLEENFQGTTRTAQTYMRLAANKAELEAKCEARSHLSIREATRVIAPTAKPSEHPAPAPAATLSPQDAGRRRERELALGSWNFNSDDPDDHARARERARELDHLETIARPVDMPVCRERFGLERVLTYRQMHQTIAELVREQALPGNVRESCFFHGVPLSRAAEFGIRGNHTYLEFVEDELRERGHVA